MHIKKATTLAILTVMGVHLAEARIMMGRKPKLFESPEHTADSAMLVKCLDNVELKVNGTVLPELSRTHTHFILHASADEIRTTEDPYYCGDKHWETGETHAKSWKFGVQDTYKRCKEPAYEAARRGASWFKCALRSTTHESVIAWSPKGMRSCKNEDQPCNK